MNLLLDTLALITVLFINPLLIIAGFILILKKKSKKLDPVAVHEAGHAVVTQALGKEFHCIRVHHKDALGEVVGMPLVNPSLDDYKDHIRIYLAGTIACELFIASRWNRFPDDGFHDNLQIGHILRDNPELLVGTSEEKFLYELQYETRQILLKNANKVKAVVELLETKNILSNDEVQEISV